MTQGVTSFRSTIHSPPNMTTPFPTTKSLRPRPRQPQQPSHPEHDHIARHAPESADKITAPCRGVSRNALSPIPTTKSRLT